MTFRVIFKKRFQGDGSESPIEPQEFVRVTDGVILDAVMTEQNDPPAKHSQGVLDEDDNFLSIGTETWDFEIADDRRQEFIDALDQSGMVIEYEQTDDIGSGADTMVR